MTDLVSNGPVTQGDPDIAVGKSNVPLVVDLDGTLSSIDAMQKTLLALIARKPLAVFELPKSLRDAKAGFKNRLAQEQSLKTETLPIRDAVLDPVKQERSVGCDVYLISAWHQCQVVLAVWQKARQIVTAGASVATRNSVDKLGKEARHLDPPGPVAGNLCTYIKEMRP